MIMMRICEGYETEYIAAVRDAMRRGVWPTQLKGELLRLNRILGERVSAGCLIVWNERRSHGRGSDIVCGGNRGHDAGLP